MVEPKIILYVGGACLGMSIALSIQFFNMDKPWWGFAYAMTAGVTFGLMLGELIK